MKRIKIAAFFLTLLSGFCQADLCESALKSLSISTSAPTKWREKFTNSSLGKSKAATSKSREEEISDSVETMLEVILDWPDTPPMELYPETGVSIKEVGTWDDHSPMKAQISGKNIKNGKFKATLLLPVSGHTGVENARKWSTTDSYSIILEDSSGNKTTLAKDAKSKALVTAHEVEITLEKGKTVKLQYVRSGSGGPSGYIGGRLMELTWK